MPTDEVVATGVALRVENGFFRIFPYENPALIPFEAAVRRLNPVVAVKIRNAAVHAVMGRVGPEDTSMYIDQETRIQILDSIEQLPTAEKDQCAAFIVRRSLTSFLNCTDGRPGYSAMNAHWYFGATVLSN